MKEEEGMYYPCSENKGAEQLRGYSEADLRLFAYADCWFSYAAAHLKYKKMLLRDPLEKTCSTIVFTFKHGCIHNKNEPVGEKTDKLVSDQV